jgi:hypothetical protein
MRVCDRAWRLLSSLKLSRSAAPGKPEATGIMLISASSKVLAECRLHKAIRLLEGLNNYQLTITGRDTHREMSVWLSCAISEYCSPSRLISDNRNSGTTKRTLLVHHLPIQSQIPYSFQYGVSQSIIAPTKGHLWEHPIRATSD